MNKYLMLLRNHETASERQVEASSNQADQQSAETIDVTQFAKLDAERHERDRQLRRGYDYEADALGHAEFLERVYQEFEQTISIVNCILVPRERLADAQLIFSDYTANFDACFDDRNWTELSLCLERLVNEIRSLC